jgi:hypothetical protein
MNCREQRPTATVRARAGASTIFARSNVTVVSSNPTRGMDVCVCIYSVCVVRCVGRGLAMGSVSCQGVLPNLYSIRKLKKCQGPKNGCRDITTTTTTTTTTNNNNNNNNTEQSLSREANSD